MFRCINTNKKCCKCEYGIDAQVDVQTVDSDEDYYITVYSIDLGSSVTPDLHHPGHGTALFSRATVNVVTHDSSMEKATTAQITIIHEVGHMLGVPHPGQRLPEGQRPIPNTYPDYDVDFGSLMGAGMELRLIDYNDMFCKNIPQEGNCSNWKATDVEIPDNTNMA